MAVHVQRRCYFFTVEIMARRFDCRNIFVSFFLLFIRHKFGFAEASGKFYAFAGKEGGEQHFLVQLEEL
jgi:hypothetical protein